MKRRQYPNDPCFYATYEGARIAALLKTCDLTFSEKLDFIDEAFAMFPGRSGDRKPASSSCRLAEASQ